MKRTIIISLLLLFSIGLFSQKYGVNNIPKELLENAGSVVRNDQRVYNIISKSKAEMNVNYAITIMHKSHNSDANFLVHYDESSSIKNIQIVIYDKDGKQIKKIPKMDIIDVSAVSSGSLYQDDRVKYFNPLDYECPYTIEYSYTKKFNNILQYPAIIPINKYDVSVQKAEYTYLKNGALRYFNSNVDFEPEIHQEDGKNVYKWEFNKLKAIGNEDYELPLKLIIPIVYLAPNDFEYDDYAGNQESWENFGNWIAQLNIGKCDLPPEAKAKALELTSGLNTKREKVKAIYEYMQSRTRYINVSIGIGGWQTYPASYVEKNSYGDCKALSNYTLSLLEAAGIKSYYTLIKAGSHEEDIIEDFPMNQFNHAIVCVPDDNDTIWLECTSQTNPFNYLGSFTEDRKALLIDKNNSKIVRTPSLKPEDNLRIRKADVLIDENLNANAKIEIKSFGWYFDNRDYLYYLDNERRIKRVRNGIHVKNFDLDEQSYEIAINKSEKPSVTENFNLTSSKYVKKLSDKYLVKVNFFNTKVDVPSSADNQKNDLKLWRSVTRIDSVQFKWNDEFKLSSLPENKVIESEFGKCSLEYQKIENGILIIKTEIMKKGVFKAEKYSALRDFMRKVTKIEKSAFVLIKSE